MNYLEDEKLARIIEFSTLSVLHHLSDATSGVSMDLINEITLTVQGHELEVWKNREKNF